MINKTFSIEQAIKKLEYYCAYQERCHQDVEDKLYFMKLSKSSREIVMLHLLENDFLNEERFSRAYARGKFRIKKWGKQRITKELKAKNISDYNIKSAMKEIDESEYYRTFDKLAEKRFLELNETDIYKKRKKLANYLLYRGWESYLVYKKVVELIN